MTMPDGLRRIAINTGGGDAPGLNAVIEAATHAAHAHGWELVGIRESYDGLLFPDRYPDGGLVTLTPGDGRPHRAHWAVRSSARRIAGTRSGCSSRSPTATTCEVDRTPFVLEAMRRHGLEALIAVGGDGSLRIAHVLHERGLRLVGVPKTIDNDLEATVLTFGFDSAVAFATECIDRLHVTAQAHRRLLVVEVMGRNAGWIALNAGLAGGADAILIPEIPYDVDRVAEHLRRRGPRSYAIVVVAEGAHPAGGEVVVRSREPGRDERLGGIGEHVATALEKRTGRESRAVVLGHLLRGGSPTAIDRVLGLAFGTAAVRALAEGSAASWSRSIRPASNTSRCSRRSRA
jgi:6-phosphofructokinase 1